MEMVFFWQEMRISKTLEIIFVRIISNVPQRKNTFWLLLVVNEGWKSFPLLEIISSQLEDRVSVLALLCMFAANMLFKFQSAAYDFFIKCSAQVM